MTTKYQNPSLEGFDFFKKMLPSFEKRKLLSQLDLVRSELNEIALPAMEVTMMNYASLNIDVTKSKMANRLANDLRKRLQTLHNPEFNTATLNNFMQTMHRILMVISQKEELLRQYIEKHFSNIIVKDGLTFKQGHVIRLIDLLVWYVNCWMNMITQVDVEINEANGVKPSLVLSRPIAERLVTEDYGYFMKLTEIFMTPEKSFLEMVESASEMNISEVASSQIPVVDSTNQPIDPSRSGFMPVIGTAILQIQNWNVSRQIQKYERNKLLKQSLELRLLNLKQKLENGETDPQIQRSIDAINSRLQKIDYDIEKFEKSAGV